MKPQYIDNQMTFTTEELIKNEIIFKKAYFTVLPKVKEIYFHFLAREVSKEEKIYLLESAEDLSILLVSLWRELCEQKNKVSDHTKLHGDWSLLNSPVKQDYLTIIQSRFNFNELGVIKIVTFLNEQQFEK